MHPHCISSDSIFGCMTSEDSPMEKQNSVPEAYVWTVNMLMTETKCHKMNVKCIRMKKYVLTVVRSNG